MLDLGLPDLPGLAVLQRFREWSQVPVLIRSILDAHEENIVKSDAGADDYVTKPFLDGELMARLWGYSAPGTIVRGSFFFLCRFAGDRFHRA